MNIFTLCWELDKRLDNGHLLESCEDLLENYIASDYVSLLYKKTEYNSFGYNVYIYMAPYILIYF